MPMWTPAVWDDFGTVGLALFVVAFHVVGYMRGWFVPGRTHREIVGMQDKRLEEADKRSAADGETIRIQAQTIAEKNAMDIATEHLLQSIRELGERGRA